MCPDEKFVSGPSCDVSGEKSVRNEVEMGKVPRKNEIPSTSVIEDKQNNVDSGKNMKDDIKPRMQYQVIQCDFCPMKYHKWSAFYLHRCIHTGEIPQFPCSVCELEFPNIRGVFLYPTRSHFS